MKLTEKQILAAKKEAQLYKGVSFAQPVNNANPFRSHLYHNGNKYDLGYYPTAKDAALAYNKKAKSLFRTENGARKRDKWNDIA